MQGRIAIAHWNGNPSPSREFENSQKKNADESVNNLLMCENLRTQKKDKSIHGNQYNKKTNNMEEISKFLKTIRDSLFVINFKKYLERHSTKNTDCFNKIEILKEILICKI